MGARIRVVIGGIHGKMGRASAAAILADSELEIVGAFDKAGQAYIGAEVASLLNGTDPARQAQQAACRQQACCSHGQVENGGSATDVALDKDGFQQIITRVDPDVYLDFTAAEAAFTHAKLAIEHKISPVIGTSGLGEQQHRELCDLAAAKKLGGIIVPNFSIGAVLMMEFARQAGRLFSNVEIVEMHHKKKVDAPSGTAMHTIAQLASTGTTFNCAEVQEHELIEGARGAQSRSGIRVH